jgi:hypothetical protein
MSRLRSLFSVERTFTPAEANSALSEVRPLVERMVAARARLRELEGEQREVVQIIAGNGSGYAVGEARSDEFTAAATEFEECIERLTSLGVQIKDVDVGLVDFPSRRGGEDVLLCWRAGEDAVEFWHDLEEGYAGRKPIDWDAP